MTALSFPPSPDTGAVYEAPNNTVYIFDGHKWNVQGTTVTAAATVNFIQDSIAPILTNIQGEGISFSYDNSLNVLTASLTGYTGNGGGYTGSRGFVGYTGSAGSDGVSISGEINVSSFGDGFELDNADKIVTRKLYSTNPSNPTTHYRLELTNGGTIKLPDQSEINGSTLKGIYGTGNLNYTGITIGPSSGNSENTWMWVDASNAYISTDYANNQHTWTFGNDGKLTLPSDIKFSDGSVQTTAWTGSNTVDYANIVNIPTAPEVMAPEVDIDGGHAFAYFKIPTSADGGGSSQRFGPKSTVFNGGGASGTYTNTLDGGGA